MAKVTVSTMPLPKPPTFEKGQLVVSSKGRIILCSGDKGTTVYAGTIVAYTDNRDDPVGFYADDWDKASCVLFQGSVTLAEG